MTPLGLRRAGRRPRRGGRRQARIRPARRVDAHRRLARRVGAFGGMVRIPAGMPNAGARAQRRRRRHQARWRSRPDRHDTVGDDLVNHCVNDILVQGATPLVFLDYVALGTLEPEIVEAVVRGHRRGLPRERLALARRRDGADAGHLHAAGLRPGRHHRRVVEEDAHSRRRRSRRATSSLGSRARAAHQRLLARAAHRHRAHAARRRRSVSRRRRVGGRRAARGASVVPRRAAAGARDRCMAWRTSPAAGCRGI